MALPALLLGLPIIDILAVFAQRIYHGMNWFRATKNHIHHRLLQLGFRHYQAVLIIYSVQGFFVASALLLRYESDSLIASLYLGVCALVFALLTSAERSGWKVGQHAAGSLTHVVDALKTHQVFVRGPMLIVAVAIPVYFVLGALWIEEVPADFALVASAFGTVLVLGLIWRRLVLSGYLIRLAVYGMATVLTYLVESTSQGSATFVTIEIVFFAALAAAIAIAVRYGRDIEFRTTTTDYLIIFLVTTTALLQPQTLQKYGLGLVVIEVVILLYGSELIVNLRDTRRTGLLFVSVLSASIVLISKGLVML
jgi:UDP-GlcNAc:undecaprenyl-phosphate GlcNAc-1-phosphate transferase